MLRAVLASLLLLLSGCGSKSADVDAPLEDDDAPSDSGPSDADAGVFPLEIGIPDVITASKFVELEEDGDVTIQDGGQGGTHALLALRFRGLGQWVFYEITITDIEGGGQVESPALVRPRPTLCDEALFECRASPLLVVIGGLADKDVWDGLHVEINARVSNEAGDEGVSSKRAFLRR